MLKLTIEIEGCSDLDVESALEEVQRLLTLGFLSGVNANETGKFEFWTTGEEEPEEPEVENAG